MKFVSLLALAVATSGAAFAEEKRELDAHEHGVGQLDIAFEGEQIAMELHAPGADIVGFEYEAESAEDKAAIEAAIGMLSNPLSLFELPAAAGCSVVDASAELESEDAHDDHDDHDDHKDEHDDHDDHKDEHNDHDDHKDEHADHKDEHDGHDHDDHADEAGHTEFHAEYMLKCAEPTAVSEIKFTYFDVFKKALELEVQILSNKGATAFEVEREEPTLELRDIF